VVLACQADWWAVLPGGGAGVHPLPACPAGADPSQHFHLETQAGRHETDADAY